MKKQKGFTLIEVVATLTILAISFALTVGTVVGLTNIQKSTAKQNAINRQLNDVDEMVSDYVSYISIPNFTFKSLSSDKNEIIFSHETYDYSLKYNENVLLLTTTYEPSEDYFYKNSQIDINQISNIEFSYDEDLNLLVSRVFYGENSINYSYIVRTEA